VERKGATGALITERDLLPSAGLRSATTNK